MENLLGQLLSVLKEENDTVDTLLKLASKKTFALSEANLDGINDFVEQEQELKLALDAIEKKRLNVSNEVAGLIGNHAILLSDIIDIAQEPYNSEFNLLRYQIQKNLYEYKLINDLNVELIESHLYYVDYMINAISGQHQQSVIYSANGYTQQEENKNWFIDNKA